LVFSPDMKTGGTVPGTARNHDVMFVQA
jgi:hypothetical protein